MSPPPKILMMTDANFLAHMSRCTEIAKVLRDRYEYEVVFAGDGKFMRLPRELGFETDRVFTVPGERSLELAKSAGLVSFRWWNEVCVRSIESDAACMGRQRPDAVVADFHWSAGTAAELCGLPYVSITNAHWTNYFSGRIRALQDHFSTRLLGARAAERFIPFLRDWIGKYWVLPYIRYRGKRGMDVSRFRNVLSLMEGDLTLLADIPEYGPTEDTPDTVRYVGPVLWEPEMAMPVWFDRLDPHRPVFYFTMGSTGYTKFFTDAIRLFGETDTQVIITTGGLFLDVDRIPSNCFIEEFAPGYAIMERSDAVVSHGGNGTVYQALSAGTPMVGIPFHLDQEVNLQRVEALGVGKMISIRDGNASNLSDALRTLLRDPSYRENAGILRKSLARYDGASLAAECIHAFLAG